MQFVHSICEHWLWITSRDELKAGAAIVCDNAMIYRKQITMKGAITD